MTSPLLCIQLDFLPNLNLKDMKPTNSSSWIYTINISILLLVFLIVANFYGPLTERFHFLKIENYLFPVLTFVHFIYMYAIKYKIRENEYPDIQMRNLEYFFYVVLGFYLYKIIDFGSTIYVFNESENLALPESFLPLIIVLLAAYTCLSVLTLHLVYIRRKRIGSYDIDYFSEENLDTWP